MTATFLERAGGEAVAHAIAHGFYDRVLADPLLRPLFRDPDEPHADRMAWWLIELFGGAKAHSDRRGGFATMVRAHRGLGIGEAQRGAWVGHMTAAVDAVGLAPELAHEFGRYLDTASRLAMNGSQRG